MMTPDDIRLILQTARDVGIVPTDVPVRISGGPHDGVVVMPDGTIVRRHVVFSSAAFWAGLAVGVVAVMASRRRRS